MCILCARPSLCKVFGRAAVRELAGEFLEVAEGLASVEFRGQR